MDKPLSCNSNWLDVEPIKSASISAANTNTSGNLTGTYIGDIWYPNYYPWTASYTYISNVLNPIMLKLSEVEYLRKEAKKDKKLRDILQKFTHLIQITVDFD